MAEEWCRAHYSMKLSKINAGVLSKWAIFHRDLWRCWTTIDVAALKMKKFSATKRSGVEKYIERKNADVNFENQTRDKSWHLTIQPQTQIEHLAETVR